MAARNAGGFQRISQDVENEARLDKEAKVNPDIAKTITTDKGIMQFNPATNRFDIPAGSAPPKEATEGKTVTTDKGVMQWNPDTQRYDIPVGGAPEKGANQIANDEQISGFASQMPTIAPQLTANERSAYAFPAGYKPTISEIQQNKAELSKANEAKISGNRLQMADATAKAAANKLTMEEKMVEQIAQDIAPMSADSLSRLRDITSMRSDQRAMIYARAREINPHFNTAEVDRKVKMLDNFTNGKDAQNIQSFGTFFEHAGNASQIVNDLRQGLTPKVLNIPLNQLEKQGYGTTATQIAAALEPVRKEFEGYLLGGRALYAEDKKAAETILNDASTPAQIQAALKIMAHTAAARYNESNTRFKNTMHADISEAVGPLSPEAYDAAGHLGITKMGGYELRQGKDGYAWYPKE
jgi:hypothetical protein